MASMTLSEYQAEVKLLLDNMQTSDPFYSVGLVTRGINRAPNRLIRMAIGGANGRNVDAFPEKWNSWTIGPTVVGANTIAVPADCIAPQTLRSADSSTLPTWADTSEQPVTKTRVETIGLLTKDSTDADYPRLWDRKANNIVYHPTTRTGYSTYLRLYGLAREAAISAAGDRFTLHEDWDDVIVYLAAEYVARRMKHYDAADNFLKSAGTMITEGINITSLETPITIIESELMPVGGI